MQYSVDLLTLGPISYAGARVYALVEIALHLGAASSGIQISPRALVVQYGQEVLSFIIDTQTNTETQDVEKAV